MLKGRAGIAGAKATRAQFAARVENFNSQQLQRTPLFCHKNQFGCLANFKCQIFAFDAFGEFGLDAQIRANGDKTSDGFLKRLFPAKEREKHLAHFGAAWIGRRSCRRARRGCCHRHGFGGVNIHLPKDGPEQKRRNAAGEHDSAQRHGA